MREESIYRRFPKQLLLEAELSETDQRQGRELIEVWNKKHRALILTQLDLHNMPESYLLRCGFLPDLSEEAITDLKKALAPLLGEITLKPVTYNPEDFISIPLYDLGKPLKF